MIDVSMSFNVEFKLVYEDTYPLERNAGTPKYTSVYRTQSNTLSFSGLTPNMNSTYIYSFSSSESPNFYSSATNVGSTFSGVYSLGGSWSGVGSSLATPYIYIRFRAAGPIPINDFCSDTAIFLQCRVYKQHSYVVVAQLSSTSTNSYSINNGGIDLLYPSSQFSISSYYGATIYIGDTRWKYSSGIGRSKTSLAPISTNSFMVFSDIYGSKRSSYETNIFFSINPNGQSIFNNKQTGSKMVISWSGLTTN